MPQTEAISTPQSDALFTTRQTTVSFSHGSFSAYVAIAEARDEGIKTPELREKIPGILPTSITSTISDARKTLSENCELQITSPEKAGAYTIIGNEIICIEDTSVNVRDPLSDFIDYVKTNPNLTREQLRQVFNTTRGQIESFIKRARDKGVPLICDGSGFQKKGTYIIQEEEIPEKPVVQAERKEVRKKAAATSFEAPRPVSATGTLAEVTEKQIRRCLDAAMPSDRIMMEALLPTLHGEKKVLAKDAFSNVPPHARPARAKELMEAFGIQGDVVFEGKECYLRAK